MGKLKDFIEKKMSMSYIYQPVMIKVMLENGGCADKKTIAQNILSYDFSQVEYYEGITNNMVGRVLRKNELLGNCFSREGFDAAFGPECKGERGALGKYL